MSFLLADVFTRQCRQWMHDAGTPEDLAAWWATRIHALLEAIRNGHVCLNLDLSTLPPQPAPDTPWGRSGIIRLPDEPAGPPLVLDDPRGKQPRLYLARHFEAEARTAQSLSTMAAEGRLCILSGGPGTGKTTTVARLLGRLLSHRPSLRIELAAPTGKAAARMMQALQDRAETLPEPIRQRLPKSASTLHRLLGWNPAAGQARHHAGNPLWLDILIVDEASMLDQALAATLLEALPRRATLVLLGDQDQLSAVEAGAVFAEISELPGCIPADTESLDAWLDNLFGLGMSPMMQQQLALAQAAAREATSKATRRKARQRRELADVQPDFFAELLGESAPEAGLPAAATAPENLPATPETGRTGQLEHCVVWLQTSYRFREDSALGRVARAIRNGDVAKALHTLRDASRQADNPLTDCAWLNEATEALSTLAETWLLAGFQVYFSCLAQWLSRDPASRESIDALFARFDHFRILAAVHRGPRGVRALNLLLDQARQLALKQRGCATGLAAWAGRPLLILENDRSTGLFNGDIGLVLPDAAGNPVAHFHDRSLPPACLPRHEWAYAMTVHKSQGSEFERIALVLPSRESPVLTRELVYTGITRARQGVAILASSDLLAEAIARPTQRDTGLGGRLVIERPDPVRIS